MIQRFKRMHGSEVIVQRHRLKQRIVIAKFMIEGVNQRFDSRATRVAALASAMLWNTERHIMVATANATWFAMVVVATLHHAAVNFANQAERDRLIVRNLSDPPVSIRRCFGLSL